MRRFPQVTPSHFSSRTYYFLGTGSLHWCSAISRDSANLFFNVLHNRLAHASPRGWKEAICSSSLPGRSYCPVSGFMSQLLHQNFLSLMMCMLCSARPGSASWPELRSGQHPSTATAPRILRRTGACSQACAQNLLSAPPGSTWPALKAQLSCRTTQTNDLACDSSYCRPRSHGWRPVISFSSRQVMMLQPTRTCHQDLAAVHAEIPAGGGFCNLPVACGRLLLLLAYC